MKTLTTSMKARKPTPMKIFADLLVKLFTSTPEVNYSSEALLSMAQQIHRLLGSGASEEEVVIFLRRRFPNFSEALLTGVRERRRSTLTGPAVVDARLIRSLFEGCPKAPTFPSLRAERKTMIQTIIKNQRKGNKV